VRKIGADAAPDETADTAAGLVKLGHRGRGIVAAGGHLFFFKILPLVSRAISVTSALLRLSGLIWYRFLRQLVRPVITIQLAESLKLQAVFCTTTNCG
jgi:hypothetical protein